MEHIKGKQGNLKSFAPAAQYVLNDESKQNRKYTNPAGMRGLHPK